MDKKIISEDKVPEPSPLSVSDRANENEENDNNNEASGSQSCLPCIETGAMSSDSMDPASHENDQDSHSQLISSGLDTWESDETVQRVVEAYFKAQSSQTANPTALLAPENSLIGVLGEEMSPVYNPGLGILPDCNPPLSRVIQVGGYRFTPYERFCLGQNFDYLLKIMTTVDTPCRLKVILDSVKAKMRLSSATHGLPPSLTEDHIFYLRKIIRQIKDMDDVEEKAYRLEFVLNVLLHYEPRKGASIAQELVYGCVLGKFDFTYVLDSLKTVAECYPQNRFYRHILAATKSIQALQARCGFGDTPELEELESKPEVPSVGTCSKQPEADADPGEHE